MSKYKTFPIQNASACLYKWSWSTLYLSNGTTNSCHRVGGWQLNDIDFKDFHNHPGKIEDRKLMLEGKWPDNNCHYCKRVEDAGGISERVGWVNKLNSLPPEMENNAEVLHVTPRTLEVYFSNLCNQSCTYCSPMFSSVIENEVKKFGPISSQYGLDGEWEENNNYETHKKNLWKWMDLNSTALYEFNVLGGEPMFQPEFMECIDFFEGHENPNLKWKIFTNLKHDFEQLKHKVSRMSTLVSSNKLKSIEIVCSIDCWGAEAEYSRHGMNLVKWEKNFDYLLNVPDIDISVQSTISPITAPTMWELTRKLNEWSGIKNIYQGWNTIRSPDFLDPCVFGHYMTEYIDKLIDEVENKITHDESIVVSLLDQVSKLNSYTSFEREVLHASAEAWFTGIRSAMEDDIRAISNMVGTIERSSINNKWSRWLLSIVDLNQTPIEHDKKILYESYQSLLTSIGHLNVTFDWKKPLTDQLEGVKTSINESRKNHEYLKGIQAQIKNSKVNPELMLELRNYLDELDRRRNLNWRSIYPWMDEIFIKELGPKQ